MKGIILAGGFGSRLRPLTKVTNKHLLPIYNKPMIYYPLFTLLDAGITDVLIISAPDHAGGFLRLLGSGRDYNAHFSFEIQEEPKGIAHALGLAEHFVGKDSCAVILGDNIYEDSFRAPIQQFQKGGHIFLKEVPDANRFGVAELRGNTVLGIEEKPKQPKSPYAVTGLYLYDSRVFSVVKTLKPSGRGELEITDVNNYYIQKSEMRATILQGDWSDAGTFESLYRASTIARKLALAGREQMLEKRLGLAPSTMHERALSKMTS